jgi:hypothetical protein
MIPLQAGAGMKRFIEGRDRDQATLFPERLDEAIEADNPVRAVRVCGCAAALSSLRSPPHGRALTALRGGGGSATE